MKILVDMDGVIANWGDMYDKCLGYYDEAAADIPRTIDQKAFDLLANRTPDEVDIIREVMDAPGFYRDLAPMPGALDALVSMLADGHDVRIVTSPWLSNSTCVQDKFSWVSKHLGKEWMDRLIITKDKTLIDGDILIDDKPEITGLNIPRWEHVLYSQPYNDHVIDKRTLYGWRNWRAVLSPRHPSMAGIVLGGGREVRSVSTTGGEKGTKPQRYDLVPVYPLDLLAELYANGAEKYSSHNWRKGYAWSNSYAAAMRHMTQFWNGEDYDEEMKLPHVTSAAFHLFALAQYMRDFPEFDDRYKKEVKR